MTLDQVREDRENERMIDEQSIKRVQETLDRDMSDELIEALKPEPTKGSCNFHAGSFRGLKQALDELLGPNKDQWGALKLTESRSSDDEERSREGTANAHERCAGGIECGGKARDRKHLS
jgi:hypothetical protein